jgi:hypothetical protein
LGSVALGIDPPGHLHLDLHQTSIANAALSQVCDPDPQRFRRNAPLGREKTNAGPKGPAGRMPWGITPWAKCPGDHPAAGPR